MTDSRKEALSEYVKSIISDDEIVLLSLNGDASFRRYFRVSGKNLIAVDAPPETQKNKEFIAIDEALAQSGVMVPKIVSYDLDRGFMILEDLGETTFSMAATGDRRKECYERAVDLLPKIAKAKPSDLPLFDEQFILFELSLFDTWMLQKALNVSLSAQERAQLDECYKVLCEYCAQQPQVCMHRDFHSRNLMECNGELAVIDFQDMVKGPLTYDLASIVYDCYVVPEKEFADSLIKRAFDLYKEEGLTASYDFESFKKALVMTSLQRHVKVLGIFCRLNIRDGKSAYLKDLPTVISYVLKECDADERMLPLKRIVEKYVEGRF